VIYLLDRLRCRYRSWRVRRRRRRLLSAYAKVGRIRYGLGPGISPIFYAYDRLQDEGLATIEDGELDWHWPEDGGALHA